MSGRDRRCRRGRSGERSPLRPARYQTSYGVHGQTPHPPGTEPPPYEPFPTHPGGGYQPHQVPQCREDLLSPRSKTGAVTFGIPLIFLIILAQAVAFIFFYDLPTKLGDYSRATAQMREQEYAMRKEATHLGSERIALRGESNRLEKERLALESTIIELEGERDALESAIHRSEQERLRFEQEKQLLEDERHLLEREKEEWKKERERWEKARGDRFPQGAFWDPLWPAQDCRAYGKREYWAALQNIPEDWTDMEACMNMPVEIKGVSVRRPYRCGYVEGSLHVHGYWMVDWDQVDCKPWHVDVTDKGCTNAGSGTRRIEAWVVGINDKHGQDWRLLCESTPFTWNHITYNSPTHCEAGIFGRKYAMWDVPDSSC